MQGGDGVMVLIGVVALIFVLAPVLIAGVGDRGVVAGLAFVLALVAAGMMVVQKGLGDTVLVAIIWLGAMLCGVAAYLDRVITRSCRNMTHRLLNNDGSDLYKPGNEH